MEEGDRIEDRSHCACAEALFGESSTKLSRRIYNNLLISKETQQSYGEREDQEKEKE